MKRFTALATVLSFILSSSAFADDNETIAEPAPHTCEAMKPSLNSNSLSETASVKGLTDSLPE